MTCRRCGAELDTERRWCAGCEQAFDGWSRQHAADLVWQVLSGTAVLAVVGMGLPLLGVSSLVAAAGVFAGFGTFVGLHRLNRHRRRHQFLIANIPRAYLPRHTT